MNIDLIRFITTGEMLGLAPGCSRADIVRILGRPEIDTPQRKSMPEMLVYGALEFRLRNGRVSVIVLNLEDDAPPLPRGLHVDNVCGLELDGIKSVLAEHDLGWKRDGIMSDDDAPVLVTAKHVHLAFRGTRLTRVGAELVR